MTRSEEVYLNKQLGYLRGKVEAYESLLYSSGILKRPEIVELKGLRQRRFGGKE